MFNSDPTRHRCRNRHQPSPCIDCGTDTTPARGPSEYYMVKSWVWRRTGLDFDAGALCIGCLETRLGRRLRPADFNHTTFGFMAEHSARLRSRLEGPGHEGSHQPEITRPRPSNRTERKKPKKIETFSTASEGGFSVLGGGPLIGPDDPPINLLGGHRWPDAARIDPKTLRKITRAEVAEAPDYQVQP